MGEHCLDLDTHFQLLERGFFAHLAQGGAPDLEQIIRSERTALFEAKKDWATDAQNTFHLRCGTLVLAAYRALLNYIPEEDAFEKVRRAFIEPTRADTFQEIAELMNTATDAFRELIQHTKLNQVEFLGSRFTYEHVQDDDRAYKLHVKQCFYHSFFSEHGIPELTRVACDSNHNWIDAIDPSRHGVRFDRPAMLGYGDADCRFYYYRLPMVPDENQTTAG